MPDQGLSATSSQIYAARTVVAAGTPVRLGASTEDLTELIVQADQRNTGNVELGSQSVQAWLLEPGDTFNCPIANPSLLWVAAVTGTQTVNLIGRKGK
jgi:hypothetical protein